MKRWFFIMGAGCLMVLSAGCASSRTNPDAASGGSSSGGAHGSSSAGGSATGGDDGSAGGNATGGNPDASADGGSAGAGGGPGGSVDGGAILGSEGGAIVSSDGGAPNATTIVIFLIDGLMYPAVQTAIAAGGAPNLKFVLDNGVRVETAHCSSSAVVVQLPDSSQPWAHATSGNVAIHTGTHLLEAPSAGMDDIFLAARRAGIKSVFSGGDDNYSVFTTPDFHYAQTAVTDTVVVQRAIDHLKNDHVRLIRIHLQRIRDDWSGPAGLTNPTSPYLLHLIQNDQLLGTLIQALKDGGVWDATYLVVGADHGMGQTSGSVHPPSTASSWNPFLAFYGPGLKKGATIPYAELPDVPVTLMHFLGLPPLKGHTDPNVMLAQKGPTGTFLSNLLQGAPADIAHPQYIEKYLQMGTFTSSPDTWDPYRTAMLALIK